MAVAELIAIATPLIEQYGIVGVFLFSLFEEIFAPVPSSFALMAAGFLMLPASSGLGEVLADALGRVVLPASVGLTIGAIFVYAVAYLGGEPLIRRWGRWFGISWAAIERTKARLARSSADELLLFGLRAVPVVPNFLVSVVCGIVHYPAKSFILITFLGSVVRAFLMSLVGWSAGAAYVTYAARLEETGKVVAIAFGALLLILVLAILLRKWLKTG